MWILDLITNNPKLLNFNLIGAGSKTQWTVLKHNGPMFPPEYEPHKIPVLINGKEIILPIQAEEYATMFARYSGSDYMNSNTFKKNFWKDFKPTLENIQVSSLKNFNGLGISLNLLLLGAFILLLELLFLFSFWFLDIILQLLKLNGWSFRICIT